VALTQAVTQSWRNPTVPRGRPLPPPVVRLPCSPMASTRRSRGVLTVSLYPGSHLSVKGQLGVRDEGAGSATVLFVDW